VARAPDLGVVAEGVETEQQAHALRQCGARFAQGFLFARPDLIEPDAAPSVPPHMCSATSLLDELGSTPAESLM
jgi:EAL domain-containing protein (putative c-di-GMP-specific phosphodiesterase class I)